MEHYETLDPADWEQTRSTGHAMIDDMIRFISTLRERPVWQPMPDAVAHSFEDSLPKSGQPIDEVYQDFKERILPYIMGNPHPRFWAWYMGSSSMIGAYADFLTSVTNTNAGAGNHVGQKVEEQVIGWMKEVMTYPDSASGLIVSGGSMANFVGLAVARHVKCGYDVRKEGLRAGQKQMTVYASTEVHSCNQKAIELLGIGSSHFRRIAVHEDYTIDLEALKESIASDKAAGFNPICVIGSAGTVNTGAIDDLNALADICAQESLWFHVDGAIGAVAMISAKVRPLLSGIERSDSVSMDLHKWMHVPFEAACVLVRDEKEHRNTFELTPEYLAKTSRGLASGDQWYSKYGLQLSRRLKALKIWMCIHEQGIDRIASMISRNVNQAEYLGQLIGEIDKVELTAPISLDIICFRYYDAKLPNRDYNEINRQILIALHEKGYAVPSYTTLNSNYCLRVAIANHRSNDSDFDFLIEKTIELGNELIKAIG